MQNKGLTGKLIRFVVIFVLAMGLAVMAVLGAYMIGLRDMRMSREKQHSEIILETSKEAMAETAGKNHQVTESVNELMLAVEDNSNELLAKEKRAFRNSVFIGLAVLIGIIVISVIIVSRRAKKRARPVVHMAERLQNMTGDNFVFEMEDVYRTGDEVEVLAGSFVTMAERMRDYEDRLVRETAEKERVKTELALAAMIQSGLLPGSFPAFPDRPEFNICASMTPAKEVGGDFYDFFFAGEDYLAMVMADVSGKGIPAALFMMMAKSMIRNRTMAERDPKKVLEDVNNMICADNREGMFVTAWIGVLNIHSGVLTASNAGHEYPVFMPPGGPFEIIKDKHGLVIGEMRNMKYTDYEILMEPGAKLFIYTDGVPESANEDGELFGMERLLDAVSKKEDASAEEILKCVEREVGSFAGNAEQFDDLTMLCIEYFGEKQEGEKAVNAENRKVI